MGRRTTGKAKGKPRLRMRGMRGALLIVAGLLLGSAMLRMGQDAGRAFAQGKKDVEVSVLDPTGDRAAEKSETLEELQAMLQAFRAREARLAAREKAVEERLLALRMADEEIERKLVRLVAAEEALADTISRADSAATDDIDRLTRVYETMKPKKAAILFEEMAPEFAAGFLARMRPEAAAGIMAGLSPEAAHRFSVVLAGRNAGVPTE